MREPKLTGSRTIILIPSISLGDYVNREYPGFQHYEERYLYFLFCLKQPQTRLIAVMSKGMCEAIFEYFVDHVVRAAHVSREDLLSRVTRITVTPQPSRSLAENILKEPRLIKKIQKAIGNPTDAFIEFFRVTKNEYELAKKLGVPYYGLPPNAFFVNYKSGARKIFKRSRVSFPLGTEVGSLAEAQQASRRLAKKSAAQKFLIKLNDSGSGAGIAVLDRAMIDLPYSKFKQKLILPDGERLSIYEQALAHKGGVIEEFLAYPIAASPSVQFEAMLDGRIRNLATHDQILRGTEYCGVRFPANHAYRKKLIQFGEKVVREIVKTGAQGIIAMDTLATKKHKKDVWKLWAIEINARKGGTNHSYFWVKYLTDARYNKQRGILESSKGDIYYRISEQAFKADWLKNISPEQLLNAIQKTGIDFDHRKKSGVFVHLLSTLPHFGKFGAIAIGHSERATEQYWKKLIVCVENLRPS